MPLLLLLLLLLVKIGNGMAVKYRRTNVNAENGTFSIVCAVRNTFYKITATFLTRSDQLVEPKIKLAFLFKRKKKEKRIKCCRIPDMRAFNCVR